MKIPSATVVGRVKKGRHLNNIFVGYGDGGCRQAVENVRCLHQFGAGDSVLAVVLFHFDEQVLSLAKRLPPSVRCYYPSEGLVAGGGGFKQDPERAFKQKDSLLPFVHYAVQEVRRDSVKNGLSATTVVHDLSAGGGHQKVQQLAMPVWKDHFGDHSHVGIFRVPNDSKSGLRNLKDDADHPDDLGIPIVVPGYNSDRQGVDDAVRAFICNLICGPRFVDKSELTFLNALAQLKMESPVITLADRWKKFPRLPIEPWRLWLDPSLKHMRLVAEQELSKEMPDQIVEILSPQAKRLPGAKDPTINDLIIVGVGGMPLLYKGSVGAWIRQRDAFKKAVREKVETILNQQGKQYPPFMRIVWSSTTDLIPEFDYLRVPIVRAWAQKDTRVRDFINPLLVNLDDEGQGAPQLRPIPLQLPAASMEMEQ